MWHCSSLTPSSYSWTWSCCQGTSALSTNDNKPGKHVFYLQDKLCNLSLCRSGDKVFWLLWRYGGWLRVTVLTSSTGRLAPLKLLQQRNHGMIAVSGEKSNNTCGFVTVEMALVCPAQSCWSSVGLQHRLVRSGELAKPTAPLSSKPSPNTPTLFFRQPICYHSYFPTFTGAVCVKEFTPALESSLWHCI